MCVCKCERRTRKTQPNEFSSCAEYLLSWKLNTGERYRASRQSLAHTRAHTLRRHSVESIIKIMNDDINILYLNSEIETEPDTLRCERECSVKSWSVATIIFSKRVVMANIMTRSRLLNGLGRNWLSIVE